MIIAVVLLVALNILMLAWIRARHSQHLRALQEATAFRAQAEYWQSVLQNLPAPVIVTDTDGAIVMFNAAAEPLVPEALDPIGAAFEQAFEDQRGLSATNTEQYIESPAHRVLTSCLGRVRYFNQRSAPLRTDERHVGAVVLLQDETDSVEQLAVAQQLRDAAERGCLARDEFIATISHELRAPLVPILSWATLLKSGKLSKADITHGLDVIERSARLQSVLVSDLMDASRIIASKLELELEPVNLLRVLETVLEGVRVSAESKCIALSHMADCEVQLLLGDKNRLQQIFWNLLSNSIKFTPTGGRIDVKVDSREKDVVVSITDTGEGIAPEFMPHLFEKFTQGDTVHARRTRGLGLGLSIVRHLVEAHGGKVTAESSGKGQGSTFSVILPLPAVPLKLEDVRPTPVLGIPAVTELTTIEGGKRENARLELSRPSAVG